MIAGQRSARQLASRSVKDNICISCRETISRRGYASAPAEVAEASAVQSSDPPIVQASTPQLAYQLRAGVVLSRPPVLTRDLHPFEKAFFLYQRRLNERLALPFTRYFYYKPDTPEDIEWKRKIRERKTPAHEIGKYHAYGKEGWNDELLVGAQESEPEWQREALLKDSFVPKKRTPGAASAEADEAKEKEKQHEAAMKKPMSRITEADIAGDEKSLNRKLTRTLYLLVKGPEGRWGFPQDLLVGRENLHKAAERVLVQSAGINMNTWVVGNVPIGHYEYKFPKAIENAEQKSVELGEKVWFMKARIFAGQADLSGSKLGLKDFKWLAKEEIEPIVTMKYWSSVRNMLTER